VPLPHSKLKEAIAAILKAEGYICRLRRRHRCPRPQDPRRKDEVCRWRPVITNIDRVSTPGRRLYYRYTEIPRVLNGLGISILSTSKGLMKDQDCRRNKAGGELVCNVW
jgi:small subunit ribosomal protein S8